MVQEAGTPGPDREAALGALVSQYQPALKQYLRSRFGVDAPTADDLVQGFLVDKVLRRDLISRAAKRRGRFRTFLLTAINRYAIDCFRRDGAAKRIPREKLTAFQETVQWDERVPEPPPGAEEFDNAFVRQVLASAVHRLHEHCRRRGQHEVWTVFYHRVLAPTLGAAEAKPYEDLVAELGLESDVEARNRLVTAKRIFKRELKAVVADYSNDSEEANEELSELRGLFG